MRIIKLEECRTKEELVNYFKALGQNVTGEEIESFKQSYEQAEVNNSDLNMQQLDNVAGGMLFAFVYLSIEMGVEPNPADEFMKEKFGLKNE